MSSFTKVADLGVQTASIVSQSTQNAWNRLTQDIQLVELPEIHEQNLENPQQKVQQQKFEGLDQLDLLESRAVEHGSSNVKSDEEKKKRRIKEIEQEKKNILGEMRMLDEEIEDIKGKNSNDNYFKKRVKIQRDESASKNAEKLVKDLKLQRKDIEIRKRKQQQKALEQLRKEEQIRRRAREEEAKRIKEEKRQAIIQRMEEEKKRKQERRLIEEQSNNLIVKLKKQEKLQKEAILAPSQIIEVEQKKKALQRKNKLNFEEIEEHDRKYRQMKMRALKEKQGQRAESLKIPKSDYLQKYGKNIWMEKLEEEEIRKKQEEKVNEEKKKKQLEKRLKYGELVKNIFMPKKRDRSSEHQNHHEQSHTEDLMDRDSEEQSKSLKKPKTPQNVPSLPKIASKRNTQNSKMFKDQSLPGMKNTKKYSAKKSVKEFGVEDEEKQKLRKIREMELRRQTNERLKKMEKTNTSKVVQPEKKKYENYLGKLKIKKEHNHQWRKIVDNASMTEEQKYKQLMKKASELEHRAKLKQDNNMQRQTDEDAVNYYIGSIQAKLALLQKF